MAKRFTAAPLPEKAFTNISDCGYKQSGMAGENPLVLRDFQAIRGKKASSCLVSVSRLLVIAVVAARGGPKLPTS
jgi:hypothetical protein